MERRYMLTLTNVGKLAKKLSYQNQAAFASWVINILQVKWALGNT